VINDQTNALGELGASIKNEAEKILSKDTKEGIIAKDADWLETAFTAKEYQEKGYDTKDWIENMVSRIKTKSAKSLAKSLMKSSSIDWWKGLKKF
jgi:5'-deoxynucleotidase YfbR-like HD superfamily hydrolase